MGIDIHVQSTTDPAWSENCKATWPDQWKHIFQIINFNPTLLYDNSPNFWTTDQLNYVLKRLIALQTNQEPILQSLKPCINTLVEIFTVYVEKHCIMIIY